MAEKVAALFQIGDRVRIQSVPENQYVVVERWPDGFNSWRYRLRDRSGSTGVPSTNVWTESDLERDETSITGAMLYEALQTLTTKPAGIVTNGGLRLRRVDEGIMVTGTLGSVVVLQSGPTHYQLLCQIVTLMGGFPDDVVWEIES